MYLITIFNIKTKQAHVLTAEHYETVYEQEGVLDEDEIMFVNDTEENNE